MCQGPDLPTGGIMVESRESIINAYQTGRGSFRVRARWEVEDQGRGTYVVVITEIPYQVQKSRLIENIAELVEAKKLPLVADVRDESAEDIRIVIEPRSPHGRPGGDDGVAVPADRPRDARAAQPQRPVARPRAAGDGRSARCSTSGWRTGARCCCGGRSSASTRSATGSRCSTATSSPISTSTR